MFLRKMIISNKNGVIRNIVFKYGLNLIIDETPSTQDDSKKTGNNVGKTTVLKLVNFCLGGDGDGIYKDEEAGHDVFKLVKDFLFNTNVKIILSLCCNLEDEIKDDIILERFFGRGTMKNSINGEKLSDDDYKNKLKNLLYPDLQECEKPTIKQLVGHHIRYRNNSIYNTTRFLNSYTTDIEYETLHLYMLGINVSGSSASQEITTELNKAITFKKSLEKEQTLSGFRSMLNIVDNDLLVLKEQKEKMNLNKDYAEDLIKLENISLKKSMVSTVLTNQKTKLSIITHSLEELENERINIDFEKLRFLYSEIKLLNPSIEKTFEEMCVFHNSMIEYKKKYISRDIEKIKESISDSSEELAAVLYEERTINDRIKSTNSYEEIKNIEDRINDKYEEKGRILEMINRIEEQETIISEKRKLLSSASGNLYSEEGYKEVQSKVDKFNIYFSEISSFMYGERYLLKVEKRVNSNNGKDYYKFISFNENIGSGKKQGEILSFDLACIKYADKLGLNTLHFLLNDKKELMSGNQLLAIHKYVENMKVQTIFPILKDKLPDELKTKQELCILSLSQEDKLFRIETTKHK